MTTYTIGDIITATSTSTAGTGATISQYEWKWDGTIISGTSSLSAIDIDTTGQSVGTHSIALRVKNSCGNWSSVKSTNLTLIEEICEPNWICEVDSEGLNTGWRIDLNGCRNPEYNLTKCPKAREEPKESNVLMYILPIGLGLGILAMKLMKKE